MGDEVSTGLLHLSTGLANQVSVIIDMVSMFNILQIGTNKLFCYLADVVVCFTESKVLYPVEGNKSLIQLQESLENSINNSLNKPAVS